MACFVKARQAKIGIILHVYAFKQSKNTPGGRIKSLVGKTTFYIGFIGRIPYHTVWDVENHVGK
jgi:hypothetical protein